MTSTPAVPMHMPRTDAEVQGIVRECLATHTPLQIMGAGSWLHAGPPVHATHTLSLRALSGIIEYVPGDLIITAHAGTSLAELQHATAAHGQWLGLDPAGRRDGTIGATIATASSGPLAHAFGTPRDQVLGLSAVTGYGDVVRPGGRVVKNVAGFDLVRLYTGSWGTLGPITAATLRLRALPVHAVTLAMPVSDAAHCAMTLARLRENTVSLLAAEWIDGTTAATHGLSRGDDVILLRLGGNDPFVRGQRAVLDRIGANTPCDPAVWGALATLDDGADAVVRFSGPLSELPARIARLRDALRASGARVAMHAGIGRGSIRVIASECNDAARSLLQHAAPNEARIVERLPLSWWQSESDPFDSGLAARIRAAFDPERLCNRRQVSHA